LNLEQYKKICKIAEFIHNDYNANEITQSIDALNIIKPHPDYLEKQKIFINKNILNIIINFLLITFINTIKWNIRFFENLLFTIFLKKNKSKKHSGVFLVSYINNKLDIKKNHFYGNIYYCIKKKYKNTNKILINNTNINSIRLSKHNNQAIILDNILFLEDELKILALQLKEVNNFFMNFFLKKKINFSSLIKISFLVFSKETKLNLRYYFQFKKLFNNNEIKFVLSPLEGYAWEKLLFFCLKKNKTISIGYQFNSILNGQTWIKNLGSNHYSPDYIFTSGNFNKKKINKINNFYSKKIFNVGSVRNFITNKQTKRKNNCLIVPEGTIGETYKIFHFAFEIAKRSKNFKFIIRTHPLINIKDFLKKYFKYDYLNKNIIISSQKFSYDLNRSKFCLFRGSTSIITAMMNGLIPIYYDKNNENFNINPMHDFKVNVKKVSNVEEFLDYILKINKNNKYNYKKSLKYSKYFYDKINHKIINNIFNKILK
jgi:hypothetical protein